MLQFRFLKRRSRILAATAVMFILFAAVPGGGQPAQAASADIVISQVYGGGGNSGASYRNDFVELFNRGSAAVSITGWSIQYAAATGSTWSKVDLSGTVQPGKYYLIQLSGGKTGSRLPNADATGTINMSATDGKVALVTHQTVLTCGASTNNCFPNTAIRDFVGYGSANNYEGAGAAPTLSNSKAALRTGAGCADTDSNNSDFTAAGPTPRNSSSPVTVCGGGGGGGTRIRDIQGKAHLSPLNGKSVSGVPGIVTAKGSTGFYMQDPTPDTDPATSEGIFVYTSTAPTRNVGDSVLVSGTVSEYRPGGATSDNLTLTEITSPSVTLQSTGNPLPAATVVGTGGRIPPSTVIDDDATGDVESSGTFGATTDGIDFWESLEGMRVQVNNAVVVGARNAYGEITVVGDNGANAGVLSARGGVTIRPTDFNPERIILDDILVATPSANVGDTMASIVGVMDYSFGNFKLFPTTAPAVSSGGIAQESTAAPSANQLAVATFNVENLDALDPQSKFDSLAGLIVNNLKSPDLLALEEVQDNNGPTNDSVVDASQTLNKLISAIQAAGGPSYQFRQINPADDQDGGEPGGNIRVAFLYRTDRGLSFIDRAGGTATAANSVVNGANGPELKYSPGRIAPTNSAWDASRKPLAGEFMWGAHKLFVIANHFNSKGGDDPLFGRYQPPTRSSETQRHQQAPLVNSFVDDILSLDPNAKVIVLGDINDFQFSQTMSILKGSQLHNPMDSLPEAERYSYVYDGNSQALDHILMSSSLYSSTTWAYDIVHVNAEFQVRVSDHDPQVVRFTLN